MPIPMDWITPAYWICLLVGIIYTASAFLLGGFAHLHLPGHGLHVGGHTGFSHNYGVGGHGGHGEAHGSAHNGGPVIFTPLSPLVIAFFLTCFGAVGIVAARVLGSPTYLGLLIAVGAAFALAWLLIVTGNRLLGGMEASSEIRINSLVGTEAEVTVAISETGIGEIAYIAMGSRNVGPARSDEHVLIPRFATVRIARVVGNIFFVRQVVEDKLHTLDEPVPASRE